LDSGLAGRGKITFRVTGKSSGQPRYQAEPDGHARTRAAHKDLEFSKTQRRSDMTKIMAIDWIRVPADDRQQDRVFKPIQRQFPGYPDGCANYGFASKVMDDKFKFRKYDNGFDKFRVEFRFSATIRVS
jgi:hypothetical protein